MLNSNSAGGTIAGLLPCTFRLVISTKTQFLDQIKINSISQLIIGIFKLLRKSPKYFRGITTSVSFLSTLFASYPSSSAPIL